MFLKELYLKENVDSFNITKKSFGNKFDDVKLGQTGTKKNDEGDKIYYRNYIIKTNNTFFTIEFMANDKDFEKLYAIGFYSPSRSKIKTVYFKDEVSMVDIISKISYSNLTRGFSINENTMFLKEFLDPSSFMLYYSIFVAIVMIITYGYQIKKQTSLAYTGYDADKKAENELNEFLFKGQKEDDAAFSTFKNISNYLKTIISDKSDKKGLVVYGVPGSSKTYMIRRTLFFSGLKPGSDYVFYKGSTANARNNTDIIYELLYRENGKLIIFDDFDSVIEDENVINILKAALDSYPVRVISLPNKGSWNVSDFERIPPKFRFTGKIVIITNKSNIDPALASRALSLNIQYTEKQWLENINNLLKYLSPEVSMDIKNEVLDFVQKSLVKNSGLIIDFRRFSSIVDLRLAYPNEWKDMAMIVMNPGGS